MGADVAGDPAHESLHLLGVFEGTPMDTVRATFETNTFGAMAVTQAFLPQFRARRAGLVVNVS